MTLPKNLLLHLSLVVITSGRAAPPAHPVGPVPADVRSRYSLDPFYQKFTSVGDLPIVSSTNTSDFALAEAAYIVGQMTSNRPEILSTLARHKVKLAVMAYNEYTTDLPEQRNMRPKVYWDRRARGLGGRTCSCAEENLLGYPGDPYATENILIHEFGHVIHGVAMRELDPTFDTRLRAAYNDASEHGRWKGTYAAANPGEYWAEAVQDWFDNNRHDDAQHNHVHTRAQLKEYDPALAKLCEEVFGDVPWRYHKPRERNASEQAHLAGFDPASAPRFQWREESVPDRPLVRFETSEGEFELELDAKAAPATTRNFLKYIEQGLYSNGAFFRTVTLDNQPTDTVRIQVVQASGDLARTNEFLAPIPLERTRETGLHHLDGTISMARGGPDTAQASFFICVGDQPALDFGGQRNPDGQGFAAFGRVVKGMDVIRKIHSSPGEGQQLQPPIRIQRGIRLN